MTTISSQNYKSILEYCKLAYELGAYKINFTNFLCTGNGENLEKTLILNDFQLKEFFNLLKQARKQYNKNELYISRSGNFGKQKGKKFYCPAYSESVVITPDNFVYPCIFDAGKIPPIGKLIDGKVMLYKKYAIIQMIVI